VIENRPGGGTVIGTEAVERAEPDGNTVLVVANSFVINPPLKRATYDPTKSFEPVCYLAATPMVLVVLGSSPYKTLNDLITAARARPGELAFASGGPGSSLHIAIEVLRRAADLNITYVPYGGTAPAINALMGGHVQAVWADYPTVVSQLKAGTLRALVTTSPKRIPELADVPTLTETGITKYEAEIFYGIVAPAKTPPDVVKNTSDQLTKAMNTPEMKAKFAQQGLFPDGSCGAKFGTFLRDITADYERITTAAGIKPN